MAHINSDILRLGVDVGSTTVKAVALDPADNSVLFTRCLLYTSPSPRD